MKTSAAILAASLLALPGCHHQSATPTATASSPPGIVVSQARLVLPVVKGNPGAAYFTLGNENNVATTLVGIDIVGAHQAEMHETAGGTMLPLAQLGIAPGQRVIFAPAGKHVMVFGIAPDLTAGGSSAITFRFQDGKTTSAPLRIEAAGNMPAMAGMNMAGGKR